MLLLTLILVTFLFLLQNSSAFVSESLKVKLNDGGVLIGRHRVSVRGRHIRAFLGIPYAKPPVGELRFKSPKPFPAWKGEKLAIYDSAVCIQIDPFVRETESSGKEDCLYLNVYTPPLKDIESIGKLPVMVLIHGGGFEAGSASERSYGPQHILDKNVILVSGNYRLSALGFLSTETLDCPGNFGLKDQVEILKWVQKHISAFGGDPNLVTIFGNSAGGSSINYLMQSRLSKGLFHRAIPQSGFIYNPWSQPMHQGAAAKQTYKLAKYFNCENEDKDWEDMISCLRTISAFNITSKFLKFFEWDYYPIVPFQPVVEPNHEGAFLDNLPRDGSMGSLDVPVMTGIATSEGALLTAFLLNNDNLLKALKSETERLFPIIFQYNHWDMNHQKRITHEIEKFYFKNGHTYNKNDYHNFTDLFSDAFFNAGMDEFLEMRHAQKSAPTFVYIYDHRGQASLTEVVGGGDVFYGVCHADELQLLFPKGNSLYPTSIPSDHDIIMREALIEMWVNFATYGNPTPPGGRLPKWEESRGYPWNFAKIGSRDPNDWYILQNEENFAQDRFNFWRMLKPFLHINKGDRKTDHKKEEL